MDEDTGNALYDERMTRSTEALAIEVVTLRAWYGSLGGAMDQLAQRIREVSNDSTTEVALSRCAGGLAAVQLLKDWTEESMGTINDFIVTMAEVD